MAQGLSEYRRKRSKPTPEPSGERPGRDRGEPNSGDRGEPNSGDRGEPNSGGRFVVHEHHARRLHWDLRLEREGVLASWAIPNGIPDDPDHNRRAVHVEDHPLDYIDFAGVIPEGSYGAGEVKVWDHGTYNCEKWEPKKVVVVFDGEQLKGRYALFQMGKQEQDWMIHRMDPPLDRDAEPMPEFVQPMLAKLSTMPAQQSRWAFEVKWDGVRALARCEPGRIHLLTRNGKDVTAAYPELRGLSRALGSRAMLLDGEIVAFDKRGRPSFQALQTRMHLRGETAVRHRAASTPVTYLVFDLLWLQGHSLMQLPYERRRELLEDLKLEGEHWRTPAHYVGQGEKLLEATVKQGLEGVIAKRLDSPYSPSRRDGSWLKIKNHRRQELVIGGWREGKGARLQQIGALELGVHDDEGHLRYAGRVGTGFDSDELDRLARLLDPLARDATPFTGRQPARGAHFVEPQLVCEVEFSEWTDDGRLRQASYQGLRDDKPAAEVVRELEQPPPEADEGGDATPIVASLESLTAKAKDVRGGIEIEVEGRTLKLTNLDKVLYPSTGFTKGDLIGWYAEIAPTLLPHLHRRPLTLKRYPDGVDGKHFYEKQSPRHRPEWVQTVTVWSEHSKRDVQYTLCEDLPTLVWLANLADIELHPSLSLADAIERPTTLAFDLDPGPPAEIPACCEVALELRELFGQFGLKAFAKTSGSKGLQVYVPLNGSHVAYEQTKPFARAVAGLLERRHPERVLSAMGKAERKGKVLIDWSQNDEHKTTVSVYSLRARERPTVSTPVSWAEVEDCRRSGDATKLRFEAEEVLLRVRTHGDLFAEVLSLVQRLPDLTQAGAPAVSPQRAH